MAHPLTRLFGAAVLASALGIASNTPLLAQSQEQPQGQGQEQTSIPDNKLESFVVAAIEVQDLIQQWSPRIENAESEDEAAQMREQANAELAGAIDETEGISVEEYQAIGQQARQDPQLNARIQEIYQEKNGQAGQDQQ